MNRGKWLIIGIFGLAGCLALFAWNHQRLRGQRVLAYYGNEVALLIRLAPEVDLWRFDTSLADGEWEPLLSGLSASNSIANAQHVSLAARPGWTHARQALIEDRTYDWNFRRSAQGRWTHILRFRRDADEALLLLDVENGRIRLPDGNHVIALNPKMAEGFRQFFGYSTNSSV